RAARPGAGLLPAKRLRLRAAFGFRPSAVGATLPYLRKSTAAAGPARTRARGLEVRPRVDWKRNGGEWRREAGNRSAQGWRAHERAVRKRNDAACCGVVG